MEDMKGFSDCGTSASGSVFGSCAFGWIIGGAGPGDLERQKLHQARFPAGFLVTLLPQFGVSHRRLYLCCDDILKWISFRFFSSYDLDY